MKKKIVKSLVLTMASVLMVGLLGACGGNASNVSSPPKSSDAAPTESPKKAPAELVFYYPLGAVPADVASVEKAINEITTATINAKIALKPQTFGDYTQKMNTVLASGDKADIIWTSNWNFDYMTNQGKGAFLPLDDLIHKFAPEVKKALPPYILDATRVDGKVYGVPNYQIVTNKVGFFIQKKYADKYGFDVNSIKEIKDIEPLLASIKKGESKEVVPLVMGRTGNWGHLMLKYNLEPIQNNLLAVNYADPHKILNMFETPEFEQYLTLVRDWYQKGYINEDAPTLKNPNDIYKTGRAVVDIHNVLKPGAEAAKKAANGGQDVVMAPITQAHAYTGSIITTMLAVNKQSKHPEEAMKFINLLNTDKKLYNLISYGIEGKHYTKNGDFIKLNPDAGYNPNANWVFGNTFNALLKEGENPALNAQTIKENETAKPSPIMGFKFVAEPVSAEIANLQTVIDQYLPGLVTGAVDPKSKLGEFRDKLKSAGIDKVVAEAQKQLNAFVKK